MPALSVTAITVDQRCQPRVAIDQRIVDDYADDMTEGAGFPPLTVYHDGSAYWLADGFHRLSAAMKLGLAEVECDVRQGTMRDAILHSVGANRDHGLRRTNADKQRAVTALLSDPEWSKWSDREIAALCGVHHQMVGTRRSSLDESSSERTYTNRYGNTTTMNTANIGVMYRCPDCGKAYRTPLHNCSAVQTESPVVTDESGWWDDSPKEPPPPPMTQSHSSTWIQPQAQHAWEPDDAKAFTALLALQDATSREARFVAHAAVATNPVAARVMVQRAAELVIWQRDFLAALKDCL